MTVRQKANIKKFGRRYAELIRDRELPVKGLWVSDEEGYPDLWILTDQIDDLDDLRPIYQALVNLQAEYPELLFDHRLLNPAWSPRSDVTRDIPDNARRIELTE
jgi:hypothetical protein